ncbi:MAG: hypothetical protein M1816_005112 [Peltula sp. TS41687]|nr:MAG: hypothetical protein M1816_005112 [Peltula sp. TS41687]
MAVSTMGPMSFGFASTSDPQASIMSKTDMDIDMDIELGSVDDLAILGEDDAMKYEVTIPEGNLESDPTNGVVSSPSTSDPNHLTPYKVHVRGLDNLRTHDIKAFASEHFPEAELLRVEWIDDTSANLVYGDADIATRALEMFTADEGGDQMDASSSSIHVLQLRSIKSPTAHPHAMLQARLAVISDRKQPGARERSRFYLFNPEEDPGERRDRRRRVGGRSSRYTNGSGEHGDYRRRRYDDEEQRRRKGGEDGFDANLYDDNVGDASRDSSSARSGNCGRGGRSVRFGDEGANGRELFPERVGESSRSSRRGRRVDRGRSASPGREGTSDGHMEIDNEENITAGRRRRFRQRSFSPGRGSSIDAQKAPANQGKELFPTKQKSTKDISTELRSTSILKTNNAPSQTKELFPKKTQNQSHHKRSPAFDATTHASITTKRTAVASSDADDPADLFAGKMMVPFTDGVSDLPATRKSKPAAAGFSILGAATRLFDQADQGFSIRGAAATAPASTGLGQGTDVARELFPQRMMGNSGKELFADRLESGRLGRLGRRRKAEDMFN